MTALVGPVLVLSGFGLYMATNTLLGRFRRMPWEFLAVSALGVVTGVVLALRAGGTANVVGAVISVALGAFLTWFFFSFSMYEAREDRPRVGERFPDFRLPTSDGAVFDFSAVRGKRHLLIFYRGSW